MHPEPVNYLQLLSVWGILRFNPKIEGVGCLVAQSVAEHLASSQVLDRFEDEIVKSQQGVLLYDQDIIAGVY
jgi:hypothetical protein